MKKYILIITLIILGSTSFSTLSAQTFNANRPELSIKKDGKYALLVRTAQHLKVSIMTGEELKKISPDIQFEIILIGDVLKDLANDASLKPIIENSEKLGIKIVACEYAMKMFEVEKEQLHSHIATTPNAFTYIFALQENGFKMITL